MLFCRVGDHVIVMLLWGAESGEEGKKISELKRREKVIQGSGTALNHCSSSCGKRCFRSIRWKNCVLWPY